MLDGVKDGMVLNIRSALSCLFKWAGEAGRKYVVTNPCRTLPSPPKQHNKTRFLTDEEIKRLWWGLDQPNLPGGRHVALALKLILTTALRPGEVLSIRRDAIGKIGQQRGGDGLLAVAIPLEEVKLRRPIIQPLNSLAQEIVAELLAIDDRDTLFPARLDPHMLARALRSKTRKRRGRVDHYPGVLEFCGFTAKRGQPFAPFTPHDLRRTAATQLDFADVSTKAISRILDHTSKEAGVGSATKIYIADAGKQTPRRRVTLDKLDELLRGFIGPSPKGNVVRFRAA
jgi:integrase